MSNQNALNFEAADSDSFIDLSKKIAKTFTAKKRSWSMRWEAKREREEEAEVVNGF